MATQELTPKQQLFVREYLKDLSAAAAYRRAGYKAATDNVAAVEGHKLLRNPKVAQAIKAAQSKRAERTELTADEVIGGLRKEYGRKDTTGAARVRALELLGKHLGMFPDKQEVSGPKGGPIEYEYRNTLTAADIADCARLVDMAGVRVPAHGGPKPLDSGQPVPETAGLPSSNGHH